MLPDLAPICSLYLFLALSVLPYPICLARKVHIGIDYDTKQLVAMKRVKFDEKVEREIRMLGIVANLSDVPGQFRVYSAHSQVWFSLAWLLGPFYRQHPSLLHPGHYHTRNKCIYFRAPSFARFVSRTWWRTLFPTRTSARSQARPGRHESCGWCFRGTR